MAGAPLPIEVADDEADVWPWRASTIDEEVVPRAGGGRRSRRPARRVLHHTGLTEFGSFEGREERERRFAETSRPATVRRIFGVLEDRRIDESTRAHYPGARRDLDAVLTAARSAASDEAPVEWRAAVLESLQLHSLGATNDELAAACCPGCGRSWRPSSTWSARSTRRMRAPVPRSRSARSSTRTSISRATRRLAIARDVDVDEPGAIQPPDDRPSADGDVERPPSNDMRQEQTDQEQIGRLADIDAIDPELPVEEDPGAGTEVRTDPVPAPTRRRP